MLYLVHLKYYYEKGVCGLYQTVNKVKRTKTVRNLWYTILWLYDPLILVSIFNYISEGTYHCRMNIPTSHSKEIWDIHTW